jgi:hypothetical protein
MALTASKAFCSGSSAKLAKKSSRASTVRMPVVVRAQAGEQAAEVVRNGAWGPIGQGAIFSRAVATLQRGYLPWLFHVDPSARCVQSRAGQHLQAKVAAGTPELSSPSSSRAVIQRCLLPWAAQLRVLDCFLPAAEPPCCHGHAGWCCCPGCRRSPLPGRLW